MLINFKLNYNIYIGTLIYNLSNNDTNLYIRSMNIS